MKIYDVFPYNGEEILLERLRYLSPVVDHFIIFESNVTQNGLQKPVFFHHMREKLAPFADKIIFIQPQDPEEPEEFTPTLKNFIRNDENYNDRLALAEESWERERRQRKIMTDHVKKIVKKEDLIIFSDADEIILHNAITFVRDQRKKISFPIKIIGDELLQNLQHQHALSMNFWWEAFIIDGKTLEKTENLSDIRFDSHQFEPTSALNPEQTALIELDGEIQVRNVKKNPIDIPRKRMNANFLQRYTPLSFHFRNFLPLTRLMCKYLYSTSFPNDGKDASVERRYMRADYQEFLANCGELQRSLNLLNFYPEKEYLQKHIPANLYQFGLSIRNYQIALPAHIAEAEYQALFSAFKPQFWDVTQGRDAKKRDPKIALSELIRKKA